MIDMMFPDNPSTAQVRSPGRHDKSLLARASRSCQLELSKCPISTLEAFVNSRFSASSSTRLINRLRPYPMYALIACCNVTTIHNPNTTHNTLEREIV